MKYSNEELLRMYYNLARGRVFTLKMHEAVNAGLIRSSFHTPYGQEAIAVGVACSLRDSDYMAAGHRDQCASIMRYDTYQFIAEVMAKDDGMTHGIGFDYHISDLSDGVRVLPPLGCLGGMTPMYAGFAWAIRRRDKNDDIVCVFQGEGSASEGATMEGWNLAALYKSPIVYVIENNKWAMTVPIEREMANPVVSEKAAAIGLPVQVADGNDILAVREVMDKAVEMARKGQPNLVELNTVRWGAHFVGQGDDYRGDREEVAESMEKDDCLVKYENYLLENGVCDRAYMDELKAQFEEEMDGYIKKAAECGITTKEKIYRKEHVWATVETGGEL